MAERVAAAFVSFGLETPRPQDVHARVGAVEREVRAAMDVLLREGRLVRVRPDYYVERGVLGTLRERLQGHLRSHGQISAQEWKGLCGVTRKYAIPLAEHFDAEKLTLRVGEVRKLRS